MSQSPNLALPFLAAGQAQKHVTVNEALRLLDALVQAAVESTALSAPPGSPAEGESWIVGPAPTGAWAGQEGHIASWADGAWTFLVPLDGWMVWDRAQARILIWRASLPGWQAFGAAGILDSDFLLRDDANPTRQARFQLSGITAGATRTLSLPNIDATLAHLGNDAQTFSGSITFSNASVTVGTATGAATYGLGAGATASGATKTVNIGTAGVSGSTTVINLGSTVAGAGGQLVVNLPDVQFAASVVTINAPAANLSVARAGIGGATADSYNRLSVNTPAVLLNNAGAGIDMTFNKAAAGNDASLSFKTGFSVRGIVGLLGDDDLTFKVSPDGSTFHTGLLIKASDGRAEFPQPLILQALSAVPASPAAGKLALYARERAGQVWLEAVRASGRDFPFQPHLGVNRVAFWAPANSTNVTAVGITIASGGTVSHPALAATSLKTQMRRWTITSAATADSVIDQRATALVCWRGNAAGLGGWTYTARLSLTTLQATGMGFFGLYASTSALSTTLVLSSVVNCIGIGFQRGTHTNWQLVHNDGSGAPTLTDLGAAFEVNTTDVLTLFINAAPNDSSVGVRVVNENSGAVYETTLSSDIPASTTFLGPRNYMNNGATAAAVAVDCAGVYLETDY